MLSTSGLETVLGNLRHAFRIAPDAELTVEVNPGTVTEEKLQGYRALGVNRLSIGIQSFREEELRFLGRIHSAPRCRGVLMRLRAGRVFQISAWI